MKIKADKKKVKSILANIFYPLLSLAIALGIWAIAAAVKDNPLVLPMPDIVIERFFKLWSVQGFWLNIGKTLLRTVLCFGISFVLSLLFAALGGLFKPFHKVISPFVTFLRSVPTVAAILVLYAFFANCELAFIIGFLIAFPIMYSAFYSAVTGVDKDLIEMAKIYKVSAVNRVTSIYLPSIADCLFDTSKSTLSLTLKVIVAAEILTFVPSSVGMSIQTAYASFEIEYLLAWTLVAIVMSFVLEAVVTGLKKLWEVTR